MSEFLTRDTAKAAALFEVEAGGARFACRVPSALELMAAKVVPPPIFDPELGAEENAKINRKSVEGVADRMKSDVAVVDAMLSCVMVKPRLWLGNESQCPADAITPNEFGPYRDELLIAVLPHLGYGEVRRKALEFRDGEGAGEAAPEALASNGEVATSPA